MSIKKEIINKTVLLTINRPEKYNALNLRELIHAHNGEISRIKNEIDDFENRLLVEKSRLSP